MKINLGKIIIKGEIEALTGLMIGGTNSTMQIGGLDKSIIRNPVTKRPYIPGSSLKGKLRSLLDLCNGTIEVEPSTDQNGRISYKYKTTQDPTHKSAKLFGTARPDDKQRPSNVIVRDGELKYFVQRRGAEVTIIEPEKLEADSLYTEFKAENFIDRITAKATPRTFERVPRGGVFALEMIVNFHQDIDKQSFLADIFQALQLLQDDYLGGSGSRGNGQVKIRIQTVTERTSAFYQGIDKEEKKLSLDEAKVPQDLR
jgi:CRISPR-associated protein Csm3